MKRQTPIYSLLSSLLLVGSFGLIPFSATANVCDLDGPHLTMGRKLTGKTGLQPLSDEIIRSLSDIDEVFPSGNPIYGKVYTYFHNRRSGTNFVVNSSATWTLVFRCDGSQRKNRITMPIGEGANGALLFQVRPGDIFKVLCLSSKPNTSFQVGVEKPELDFEVFSIPEKLQSGDLPVEFKLDHSWDSFNSKEHYGNCPTNGKIYRGGDKLFKIDIAGGPGAFVKYEHLISVTATSGQVGLFLLKSLDGKGCIKYVETPKSGGTAFMSDKNTLEAGTYYLVVDRNHSEPVGKIRIYFARILTDRAEGMPCGPPGVTDGHQVIIGEGILDQFMASAGEEVELHIEYTNQQEDLTKIFFPIPYRRFGGEVMVELPFFPGVTINKDCGFDLDEEFQIRAFWRDGHSEILTPTFMNPDHRFITATNRFKSGGKSFIQRLERSRNPDK